MITLAILAAFALTQAPKEDLKSDQIAIIHDLIRGFDAFHEHDKTRLDADVGFDVQALLSLGRVAEPQLVGGLKSRQIWLRYNCAYCLGQFKDPTTAPALEKALAKEADLNVQGVLASAYGACAGAAAIPGIAPLADSSDMDLRRSAVDGLGNTGSPGAIPWLAAHMDTRAISQGGSTVLMFNAGEALAKIGPASYSTLVTAFSSPVEDIRKVAAVGLERLNDPRAKKFVQEAIRGGNWPKGVGLYFVKSDRSFQGMFLALLKSSKLSEVNEGLPGIEAIDPSIRAATLCNVLSHILHDRPDWSYELKSAVLEIADQLAILRDPRSLEPLIRSLEAIGPPSDASSDTYESQNQLIRCLGLLREPRAVPMLLQYVRGSAHGRNIGGSGLLRALARKAQATTAAEACAKAGLKGLAPLAQLYKRGLVLPTVYAEALSDVDDNGCLGLIEAASADSNSDVQRAAIEALGTIKAIKDLRHIQATTHLAAEAAEELLSLGDVRGLRYFRTQEYKGSISAIDRNTYVFDVHRARKLPRPLDAFATSELRKALKFPGNQLPLLAALTLASRNRPEGWKYLDAAAIGPDRWTALQAIGFLSRRPTGENREALLRVLKTPSIRLRFEAYEALLGNDASGAANWFSPAP